MLHFVRYTLWDYWFKSIKNHGFDFAPRIIIKGISFLILISMLKVFGLDHQAYAGGAGTTGDPFTTLADAYTVPSGRYSFNLGNGLFSADVDNSEGGGWVLVLQYVHQGGTNPPLSIIGAGADLPITSTAPLGTDESSDTTRWGHAGNAAMSQFTGDIELRWYGDTNAHSRIIHFRSTVGADYVRTGLGNMGGIQSDFTALSNHTANLPAATNSTYSNSTDYAMTNFPFWNGGTYHWGISGGNEGDGANGFRWEVDDFPGSAAFDTRHRVWVRATAPLEVTNTNDTGEGSLRQAIIVANADTGLDTITFDIPTAGPHTINVATQLPNLTDTGIIIDGSTQTGASCGDLWAGTPHNIQIQINDGGSVSSGLVPSGVSQTIRGLSVTGFNRGINLIAAGTGTQIECNYLGIAPDGTAAGNDIGVIIFGDDAIIGGSNASAGNVISGNGWGVLTSSGAQNVTIENNFVGTDPTGTLARGNTSSGLGNNIGSATINEIRRNLISGNNFGIATQADDTWSGVSSGSFSIAGNYIGTNRTGDGAIANNNDGINFTQGTINNLIIGGTAPADRNIISGNTRDGLAIANQDDVAILGNYIGLAADGLGDLGNGANGISLQATTNVQIGNGTANGRNVIGSNVNDGIQLSGTIDNIIIDSNYIGLAANGDTARGNGVGFAGWGIEFNGAISDGEIIRNNVISDNGGGLMTINNSVTNASLTGNYFGTDATGLLARGNEFVTIELNTGANGWSIGTPASGNIFAATRNTGAGLDINDGTHTIQNNLIGVGADGTTPLGNDGWGLRVVGGSLIVGGTGANEANVIAHSGESGILVQASATAIITGNTVFNNTGDGIEFTLGRAALLSNSIFSNGGIGIDLTLNGTTGNGVTLNDSGDADTGANDLLNFPVFNALIPTANNTDLLYDFNLDVPSNTNGYRIEFFKNLTPDGSGHGEGEIYLGFVDVVHGGGDLNFTGTFTPSSSVSNGDSITATATRKTASSHDITSEFAANFTVQDPLVVTSTNDDGIGSLRQAIIYANANTASDAITFDIPGAGPHTISIASALPAITDDGISIDGSTQTGASCNDLWAGAGHNLQVQIDGQFDGTAITMAADNVTIRGLSVTGAPNAIQSFSPQTGLTIECNYVGVTPAGVAASQFNTPSGRNIIVTGGIDVIIDQNVVSNGVEHGVVLFTNATNATITNNFIGTDPTGTAKIANNLDGFIFWNGTFTIANFSNNLISGNGRDGLLLFEGATVSGVSGDAPFQGNYIGVDRTGNAPLGNGEEGIETRAGTTFDGVTFGGTGANEGNIISSNSGIGGRIDGLLRDVTWLGNNIGVGLDGSTDLGNGNDGLAIDNNIDTTFGDNTAQGRNVIAGNGNVGIRIDKSLNLSFLGNHIGVDRVGNTQLTNAGTGLFIGSASGANTNALIDGNVISGNNNGVDISSQSGTSLSSAASITLTNNKIGVGADGTTAIGNAGFGIKNANVPGDILIQSNIIANNSADGVVLTTLPTTNAAIISNSIYNNGDLGIDFNTGGNNSNGDGVTANDANDADTGPNDLLNFPEFNGIALNGGNLIYDFNLDVPSNTDGYRIEFFKNLTPDGTGHGEGEIYLGSIDIAHAGGDLNFNGTFTPSSSVGVSDSITATTTRKTSTGFDITSEFAANTIVGTPNVTIDNAYDLTSLIGLGTVTQTITVTNTGTQALTNPVVTSAQTQNGDAFSLPAAPSYLSGDTNSNGIIDIGETWLYEATVPISEAILNNGNNVISIASIETDQTTIQASLAVSTPVILSFPLSAPNRCVGTNLLTNGGFETPELSLLPRSSSTVNNASVDDWTGGSGGLEIFNSGLAEFAQVTFSHSGAQHTELNTTGIQSLTASASIESRSEVSVFWAHRGRDGTDTASLTLTDDDGGSTSSGNFTTAPTAWSELDATHVANANAANITLTFDPIAVGGGDVQTGNFLDSVEVCQTYITLASSVGARNDVNANGADSVGDTVPYQFTISNPAGNHASLSTVEIVDTKLGTFTATPTSGDDGDGVLEPGETWIVNRDYTLVQADIDTGNYTSVHYTQGDTGNNVIRSDDLNQTVTLAPNKTVDLVKTGTFTTDQNSDGLADAGDVITYSYAVTNNGDVTLTNISITDVHNGLGDAPAPVHNALTDNGTLGDSTDTDGDPAIWESLAPGDVITFTWDYTVVPEDVEQLQ